MTRSIAVLVFACFVMVGHSQAESAAPAAYTAKCQMCHGATGLGDTPAGKAMGARPFKAPEVVKESDADLLAIIKNGKGKMPAFAGKLNDAEMTSLIAYIRKLQ